MSFKTETSVHPADGPKPRFGWVIEESDGHSFGSLAKRPSSWPAQRTWVFDEEEERINWETSLFLHRNHKKAFSQFPEFATHRADPFFGASKEEVFAITPATCPQLLPVGRTWWPWQNTDPGVTFDAGVTLALPSAERKEEDPVVIITISARYPMIHLAWLWALTSSKVHLAPIFVVRQPMLIMAVDPDKPYGTQIEIPFRDEVYKTFFPLLRSSGLQTNARVFFAVPKTEKAWLDSEAGNPVSRRWDEHALIALAPVRGAIHRPKADDKSICTRLSRMNLVSSNMQSLSEDAA